MPELSAAVCFGGLKEHFGQASHCVVQHGRQARSQPCASPKRVNFGWKQGSLPFDACCGCSRGDSAAVALRQRR